MGGGHTEGKIGIKRPVLLYRKAISESSNMGMSIYKSRHDRLSGHIVNFRISRNRYLCSLDNCLNTVLMDNNCTILKNFIALHRENSSIGKGNSSSRLIHRHS